MTTKTDVPKCAKCGAAFTGPDQIVWVDGKPYGAACAQGLNTPVTPPSSTGNTLRELTRVRGILHDAREIVEYMEWVEVEGIIRACMICGQRHADGHAKDCKMASLIAKLKTEAQM